MKKKLIFQKKNEPFWNAPIQPASAGDLVEIHDQKLEEVTTQGSKYSCNFFPHPNTLSNVVLDMRMETDLISPFENLHRSIFCGVSDLVIAKQCGYVYIGVFISAETLRAKYLFRVDCSQGNSVLSNFASPAFAHRFTMLP